MSLSRSVLFFAVAVSVALTGGSPAFAAPAANSVPAHAQPAPANLALKLIELGCPDGDTIAAQGLAPISGTYTVSKWNSLAGVWEPVSTPQYYRADAMVNIWVTGLKPGQTDQFMVSTPPDGSARDDGASPVPHATAALTGRSC